MIKLTTDKGDFDLFGDENIVQTFSIFNLENITGRSGEYSNVFNLPLTNNNIAIIGNAQLVYSTNSLAYNKVTCDIFLDGLFFKKGFISIESIQDTIKARFYSGNSLFYDLIKSININELNWSSFDHIWDLTNAIASSANTSGYFYPLVQYGGQSLISNTLDVRKILPSTYCTTILDKIITEQGYSYSLDFDTTDFNDVVLPYSQKNPKVSPDVLLKNKLDVGCSGNYLKAVDGSYSGGIYSGFGTGISFFKDNYIWSHDGYSLLSNSNDIRINTDFDTINTVGSSTNYDFVNRIFKSFYAGTYHYNINAELVDYDFMTFNFTKAISGYFFDSSTEIRVYKKSSSVITLINTVVISNGAKAEGFGSPDTNIITNIPQTFITSNAQGDIYLDVNDELFYNIKIKFYCRCGTYGVNGFNDTDVTGVFTPEIKSTSYFEVDLKPELVFGGLITYSSMLPKIKASDFLKDILIRFGLILNVDENNKFIYIRKLDTVINNIQNANDWSIKLDEQKLPNSEFSYNSYARNNNFKHKEDKSILKTLNGTDYVLFIDNKNLEKEKDLYISPFAPSEFILYTTGNTLTAYINLYDVNTSEFDNDVSQRICFREQVNGIFKFTDGSDTSAFINVQRIYFIDDAVPDKSMGFSSNLIPKNSNFLISTLQNLRIIKADFNLNILDIINLDYFTPVYINQFQAYFFISSINQFNYTNPNLTEVELIKLNP